MAGIVLENGVLKAEFDGKTGALTSLVSKATKWRIQNRPELAMSFKMQVPLPERRNNLVIGTEQKLDSVQHDKAKKKVVFTWKKLKPQHCEALDISMTATVTLTEEGLIFDAEIDNRAEGHVVEALWYPCLGDVPMPDENEPLWNMYCHCSMERKPLLPRFQNEQGYWGFDGQIQEAKTPFNPFVLIASDKQGLYAGCHDEKLKWLVQYFFELWPGHEDSLTWRAPSAREIGGKPVHMQFSAVQMPYLKAGAKWRMSPIILKPYIGTWHKGADTYRKWLKTWLKRAPSPEWTRDVRSWLQIHINSPEDELRYQYKELVDIGRECAKHGVKAIQLVGWNNGGQDRGNPSHDTDPRLGTIEEFKEAIRQIHEMGVKVVLFNKYTWVDTSTEWYRDELHKFVAQDPYGNPYHHNGYEYQTPAQFAEINVREFEPMCHLSARWRKIACREFEKNFQYGAAGMLYDEAFHHGRARYCFDPNHGHDVPAFIFDADNTLAEEFRAISASRDPDFLFSGEALFQQQWLQYSLSYFRIYEGHVAGQRYIDPWCNLMVAVQGFDDRDKINLCLLYRYIISYEPYNFKGRPDDFPLTIEYGKKVDALRRRYSEYLWDAEYRDILGAEVTVDGGPHTPYSVFVQPGSGRRAVAIANQDKAGEIEVNVEIETSSQSLVLVTPEEPEPKRMNGSIRIPPRSLAVVLEE